MRTTVLALVVLAVGAAAAPAQNTPWAEKMFKGNTAHDFGSVPRGAQLYYRFPMTNIWAVPLELTAVRASCGCVSATPTKQILQPRETAYLDVSMDAHRFTGPKTVSIYLTLGPQYTSTATVRVSANSRADVVFNPGQVNFGVVQRGQTPVQTIEVEYAGVLPWQVLDIDKGVAPVDVTLEQIYREPGRVGYRLHTALKADAPPGLLKQELFLRTNDPASPLVPVLVEGMIQAPLTVKPSNLRLGSPKVGDTVTRRVNVVGSKPFKIVAVDGLGEDLRADLPPNASPVQNLTFTFQPSKAEEVHRQLLIRTDLPGQPPVAVTIDATVAP